MVEHRILFVCLGNICRSSMAEGVFRHLAEAAGMGAHVEVDSAGTGGWHVGEPPDTRGQAALRRRDIDISAQRARRVTTEDFRRFDLLLAMDDANRQVLLRLAPAPHDAKVRLFLDYAPETGPSEVPDPYYGGPDGFDHVVDLVEAAGRGLLSELIKRRPENPADTDPD